MSEQKMREALEQIKILTEIPFARTSDDYEMIYRITCEALDESADRAYRDWETDRKSVV